MPLTYYLVVEHQEFARLFLAKPRSHPFWFFFLGVNQNNITTCYLFTGVLYYIKEGLVSLENELFGNILVA